MITAFPEIEGVTCFHIFINYFAYQVTIILRSYIAPSLGFLFLFYPSNAVITSNDFDNLNFNAIIV